MKTSILRRQNRKKKQRIAIEEAFGDNLQHCQYSEHRVSSPQVFNTIKSISDYSANVV